MVTVHLPGVWKRAQRRRPSAYVPTVSHQPKAELLSIFMVHRKRHTVGSEIGTLLLFLPSLRFAGKLGLEVSLVVGVAGRCVAIESTWGWIRNDQPSPHLPLEIPPLPRERRASAGMVKDDSKHRGDWVICSVPRRFMVMEGGRVDVGRGLTPHVWERRKVACEKRRL